MKVKVSDSKILFFDENTCKKFVDGEHFSFRLKKLSAYDGIEVPFKPISCHSI